MSSVVQAEDTPAVLNGDVNGDGKVDKTDASAVAKAKLADCPQADVNADGVLDQNDADMITSFADGEIGYFPVGTYYNAKPGYVTRGEWIHALAEGFAMSVEDESTITEYFTDLKDCAYKKDIDLAANFGVFDVLEEEFRPDAYVTRDFAAHTMNFCIGYADSVTILFTDTDAVYYDTDAQVALNRGWFKAENSEFRPSIYVTAAEAALAYADMKTAYESMQIDDDYDSTITYDNLVLDLTGSDTLEYSSDRLVLSATDKSIEPDSDIAFMLNGQVVVRHVTDVSTDEETGNLTLTVEDAADALVSDVDAEGYAYIDYEHFVSLQDGIDVEIISTDTPTEGRPGASVNKSGKVSLDNFTVNISGSKTIGGGKLTVGGSLSGKKSGGYVKGSGYTSGYSKGTKGQTVQPVYYKSTIVFKEMEPPRTISEDMVLTEDTVIRNNLLINSGATLDLNGHKLTVEGNVTINRNGKIFLNNGSLIVEGDYYCGGDSGEHQSGLEMVNKDDYALIKGNAYFGYGEKVKTAGTLELQGDISGEPAAPADDLNGDGAVTVADAVLLARFVSEDPSLTEEQVAGVVNADPDYDGDGMITLLDIRCCLKKLEAEP